MFETAPHARAAPVSRRAIALSIVIFWAFYFAIATARAIIGGEQGQVLMLAPRVVVSLGAGLYTMAIYLLLRRIASTGTLVRSIAAAMLLSVPAAAAYGATNWCLFDVVLPSLKRASAAATAQTGANSVVVGAPVGHDTPYPPAASIADTALNGYFFFIAWSALYLALSYAAQLGALERRSARLREAAQAAELRALRYQVNPHFLFNTMNSLSSLVMAGRTGEAEQMIVGLSTFFRASLASGGTEDVPLSEEIALQRLYLEIERVRFGDRLHVAMAVPADLENACVPGLILQPLVENVVKHAVSRTRRAVHLRIDANAEAGRLRLQVRDDGTVLPDAAGGAPGGVGLANVRDRLAARFGDDGTLCWERTAEGFGVTLTMPLIRHGC
ncbi:MAG: histidine kinase [Pseudomonadota bacterium]|nr:histidine kinase [Pseudomonadota bacterium]